MERFLPPLSLRDISPALRGRQKPVKFRGKRLPRCAGEVARSDGGGDKCVHPLRRKYFAAVYARVGAQPLKFLPDIATLQWLSVPGHKHRAGCDIRSLAVDQKFLPQFLWNQDFAPFGLAIHDRLASPGSLYSNETQFGHANARHAERPHEAVKAQIVIFPRRVQEAYVLRFCQVPVAVAENPSLHFKLFQRREAERRRFKTLRQRDIYKEIVVKIANFALKVIKQALIIGVSQI